MNRQNEKKISWCDATVNPVMGCPRLCGAKFDDEGKMIEEPWCYAYKQNKRFKWLDDFSKPQFFPERLKEFESKKPKAIFIDSMSDIEFWQPEWEEEIWAAMEKNPQHNYIMLTKTHNWFERRPANWYIGATIDTQKRHDEFWLPLYDFLSIEPILEPIKLNESEISNPIFLKQIIIGAQTGNRKDKVIPQKQWIDDIVRQADRYRIRVYMKESLRRLMGKDFRQDRLIWEVSK
jgi:protein gp37